MIHWVLAGPRLREWRQRREDDGNEDHPRLQ